MKPRNERIQLIETESQETEDTANLWVGDERRSFPVVKVPVDALALNVDNRRFRAERLLAEEMLERPLDPENSPDDEHSIESLLLDTSHRLEGNRIVGNETSDTVSLKNDWLRRGQDTPFWIRPDGTVRNGNRRLAIIKRLARTGGGTGLNYVDSIIFSESDINEHDLLELEQHEQLTENFKVRYNDIDYLLAVREAAIARDIDWFDQDSIDRVAGELQLLVDKTKSEVVRDLYAIKYMDVFLAESEQDGQYHRLIRTLERFRDIGRTMMEVEVDYALEADRVLQVLFAAVRSGHPHGDIRKIRQMFKNDRDRFDELASEVDQLETDWGPTEGAKLTLTETEPSDEAEEEEEDDEGPGPGVENYPKEPVEQAISVAIDGFDSSKQKSVLQTLKEILNRLEVVTGGDALEVALQDPEHRDAALSSLRRIVEWAELAKQILDDEGSE